MFDIKRSDLVLEVGSGNRPVARSDVLCDLGQYGQNSRYIGNMLSDVVMDRPFAFGNAQRLPFRDDSFDFLIASHVLEHLDRPDMFLNEACRVSPRGCIITPSEIFEKIFDEPSHLWYISVADGRLKMRAKVPVNHESFGKLFRQLWGEDRHLRKLLLTRPDIFEICYFYSRGKIDFAVENAASPPSNLESDHGESRSYFIRLLNSELRSNLGRLVRLFNSKRKVDFNILLACPLCAGHATLQANSHVQCEGCGKRYPLKNGCIPVMIDTEAN